ncbi:glycoside-pentoside-hexuronide :cation symporter family [Plasmopara halstedii]|uniref:Glycoside-pentoside-hexuronide: cation symporter family n=1 Tax=Plasmopara halstedii TaxID=4781 RepID=A0A0P1AMS1_PLAHL|nr:glycoside-pentoside-hexuronide :cation symporter family [Plasmopara halstedii]CEG42733.1 glycoside-pentoside-hexuronide :cation symporter family [Plasmopara halstedii]|eukprot:XP_024579102.1 glycoside-pentoside-hexuronide :cation symporter family [Plasmopara halstedii]
MSGASFASLDTPETPTLIVVSPVNEEKQSIPEIPAWKLLIISMPRLAIRMSWAARWAALGPYLRTMLPPYAVQLTQLSGPLCGIFLAPIIGVFSDRSTCKFGRRRPFLVLSAIAGVLCWILMSYTHELGNALGDVGTGKPGEVTDRTWTAVLTVFFYLCTDITVSLAQIPAVLLISDFAGKRQTLGAALGQGWATLGAIIVALYTEAFVCIGAACYVANEIPRKKQDMEKRSCCGNVMHAFSSIYSAVFTLPKVLMIFCFVMFLNQYAFASYNSNKGMFFGIEVFKGDATNAATCGDECSKQQLDYNRGVQLAGGLIDLLYSIVGYMYSWVLPPLIHRFGAQRMVTLATIPLIFLIFVAFNDVVELSVVVLALTSITVSTFFALAVPIIVQIFGITADIGVYVGVISSANASGLLLNFIAGSALVETSLGYRLPVFLGGVIGMVSFLVCLFFFKIKMTSM